MKKLIIATIIVMSVGCSATNKGVSLDASPLITMNQKMRENNKENQTKLEFKDE